MTVPQGDQRRSLRVQRATSGTAPRESPGTPPISPVSPAARRTAPGSHTRPGIGGFRSPPVAPSVLSVLATARGPGGSGHSTGEISPPQHLAGNRPCQRNSGWCAIRRTPRSAGGQVPRAGRILPSGGGRRGIGRRPIRGARFEVSAFRHLQGEGRGGRPGGRGTLCPGPPGCPPAGTAWPRPRRPLPPGCAPGPIGCPSR